MNTTLSKLDPLIIFTVALCLFTFGLSNQEFIGFETRFALFAKEMLVHGFSLFPTTYQQPYPDYPITSTYLIYLIAKLFGHLNKFTAVLPSAIAAAITVTCTYAIGALHDRKHGLFAAALLLMTGSFLTEARTISIDQYTTAITCLVFYLAYSVEVYPSKIHRLFFIPCLLILGFAFRGPIGLIIPSGVLSVYYLLEKNYKKFFLFGIIGFILLIFCNSILVFLAYQTGGIAFAKEVFNLQVFSRLPNSGHAPAFYYYFFSGIFAFAITMPLSMLVLIGLYSAQPNSANTSQKILIRKLIAWVLIILIGLSIPGDKKMRYILAISPALALISAYLFILPKEKKYLTYLYKVVYQLCFYAPSLGLLISLGIMWFCQWKLIPLKINLLVIATGFVGLQLSNFLIAARTKVKVNNESTGMAANEFFMVLIAALSFVMLSVFCLEPLNLTINRTRDFVRQVEQLRYEQHAQLAFYQEGPDGLPIKYLINSPSNDIPWFISDANALSAVKTKVFIIAGVDEFSQIPQPIAKQMQIIAHDIIGRKPVVVFTQRVSKPIELISSANQPAK